MIAYCGLDCSKCGAFLATQANDDALRAKTSEEWSKGTACEQASRLAIPWRIRP